MRQNKMTSKYVPKWIPATLAIGNSVFLIILLCYRMHLSAYAQFPMILGVLLLIFYYAAWLNKANTKKFALFWKLSIIFNLLGVLLVPLVAITSWFVPWFLWIILSLVLFAVALNYLRTN